MSAQVHQPTADLNGLVGRYASSDPEADLSTLEHVVMYQSSEAEDSERTGTILSAAISSNAIDSGLRATEVT